MSNNPNRGGTISRRTFLSLLLSSIGACACGGGGVVGGVVLGRLWRFVNEGEVEESGISLRQVEASTDVVRTPSKEDLVQMHNFSKYFVFWVRGTTNGRVKEEVGGVIQVVDPAVDGQTVTSAGRFIFLPRLDVIEREWQERERNLPEPAQDSEAVWLAGAGVVQLVMTLRSGERIVYSGRIQDRTFNGTVQRSDEIAAIPVRGPAVFQTVLLSELDENGRRKVVDAVKSMDVYMKASVGDYLILTTGPTSFHDSDGGVEEKRDFQDEGIGRMFQRVE